MRYPSEDQIIWQFDTASLRVVCHAEPEDTDPADAFQFEEDVEMVRSGQVNWFCAFVSVWVADGDHDPIYLAHDVLGGCAYRSFNEFVASHRDTDATNRNTLALKAQNTAICHYFPSMVAEACSAARSELRRLRTIPVRLAS